MIRLIAAVDTKRGIATKEGIPWKLPGDTAYFREQTRDGLIVMGWTTYTEFKAPLHERENYVISRSSEALRPGFTPVVDLAEVRRNFPGEDIWVVGGATVYRQTIAEADELLLTQVLGDFNCTVFFPRYDATFFAIDRTEEHEEGGVRYRFETWGRRQPVALTTL